MNNGKSDVGLIVAIIFASAAVSGSLVFFATQAFGGGITDAVLSAKIQKGIEDFVEKQKSAAEETQASQYASTVKDSADKAKKVDAISATDHVYGNKDAKYSLIEYSDFQCPFCQRFHGIAKQVVDYYKGEVNWIYRHNPLSFHEPGASRKAIASECVASIGGNDKFWQYSDMLFNASYVNDDSLLEEAKSLGIDETKFKSCMNSGKFDALLAKGKADATEMEMEGTPGNVLLDNETGAAVIVDGAQPLKVWQKVMEQIKSNTP